MEARYDFHMQPVVEPDHPLGAMLIIVTDDHKLVLHHRDDIQGIAHPGCWAGFGGAVEAGETVEVALRREFMEETGLEAQNPIYLIDEIDLEGDGRLVSLFFIIGGIQPQDINLREGQGIGVFSISELADLNISPFVRRAIHAHLLPMLSSTEG
jgi:8-oxo-dGTP pyrophosphatase MutT (NUDIX family)